jgi:hypothetical protein
MIKENLDRREGVPTPSPIERCGRGNGTNGKKAGVSPVFSATIPDGPALALDLTPDAGEGDLERVLLIVAPGGASDNFRATVINALADAKAGGVSPAEVAAALPRAGPGRPWNRIAAAAALVIGERRRSPQAPVTSADSDAAFAARLRAAGIVFARCPSAGIEGPVSLVGRVLVELGGGRSRYIAPADENLWTFFDKPLAAGGGSP